MVEWSSDCITVCLSLNYLDIGEACIRHCSNAMGLPDNAWTFKSIIDNIFVFRCREITELLSCVMILKEFLKTHDQVSDNLLTT